MSGTKKKSRLFLTVTALVLVVGAIAAAFWPRAQAVDLATVSRGMMTVIIYEEGRTRVREAYVVSTPIAGRLQRVQVEPGELVVKGETVVAQMLPTNPAALDVRTREQALAAVAATEAALRVAHADRNAAIANRDLALSELERSRRLSEHSVISEAALNRAEQNYRVNEAMVGTAEAAIAMREAELKNVQAQLIRFDDPGLVRGLALEPGDVIPLFAPADGTILRIMQQSETTLPAGAPIMEIGNVDDELEVVVELISSDAVQVATGDPVVIEDWGRDIPLSGEVTRVDPFALTRYSALGVEEQRVPVTIAFTGEAAERGGLGHGYRVTAGIVVWKNEDTLIVPSAALFREGDHRAAFVDAGGKAVLRICEIGRNNGTEAEVLNGLSEGERVILYPSASISDGASVVQRSIGNGSDP